MKQTMSLTLLAFGLGSALLVGCTRQLITTTPATGSPGFSTPLSSASGLSAPNRSTPAKQQPVAPEVNPPGDIPDSQAFVGYTSTVGHYRLEVPEGWARREIGADVSFIDKLDGVTVSLTDATNPLTADSVRTYEAAHLEHSGQAVQIVDVKDVQLPHGSGVLIQYTSNSEADPTTGKQVRLENEAYLFVHNGRLATLRLWAPQGADNVDQWQRMSRSFGWS